MYGMTKKEFHTLMNIQWRRLLEGENKDDRPKNAQDSNESIVTLIESSGSEEWEEKVLMTIGTESHNTGHSSGITSITVKYTSGNTRELYILLDTGSKDITWQVDMNGEKGEELSYYMIIDRDPYYRPLRKPLTLITKLLNGMMLVFPLLEVN